MKPKSFIVVVGLVAASAFLVGAKVQAQESCVAFHAVIQAELFPENPLREGDPWGGNVYAHLGHQVLMGRYSGNNGNTSSHGRANFGVGGTDAFDFGGGNTFTAEQVHASFPTLPGQVPDLNGGTYLAADKIATGTGMFQSASGSLTISGPWLVWVSDGLLGGRWNGEVDGKICGVQ